ncbi:MAG: DUF3866 family protein [Armatimonadetes bacterium]|nr:DUF3866 family protein [Armatimonadota bacterium]
MICLKRGAVTAILSVRQGAMEMSVRIEGEDAQAVAYPALTGDVAVGDEVLLNTTAVRLRLGTGGVHFVVARLDPPMADLIDETQGHIVKLRYTPLQHAVTSIEEESSPHRQAVEGFVSLAGMPVLAGELHSHLLPAVLGARQSAGAPVIACIMTDTAALPIAFSRTVALMKDRGWLAASITAGQSFGGDYEAVNLYTALIAAKEIARADLAVIVQGPGNVGTGTRYGFSGLAVAEALHAASVLGGTPVAIPRIGFADPRDRHRGLSHHTQTTLGQATLARAFLPMPQLGGSQQELLEAQLEASGIILRHDIRWAPVDAARQVLEENAPFLQSMGRGLANDPVFFLAAAVAGAVAGDMIKG